jgi:hypothetical protein
MENCILNQQLKTLGNKYAWISKPQWDPRAHKLKMKIEIKIEF